MFTIPIVLIHGFPLDPAMWASTRALLEAQGATVITPTLPGFGDAAALPEGASAIRDYAVWVAGVIRELPGKKAIVGGFSMGGYIALALAREFSELLAGVMLIDTRADADSAEARAGREQNIELVKTQGVAPLAEAMLGKVLSKNATEAQRAELRSIMLRQPVQGVVQALAAMRDRPDQSTLLPTLKLPLLIVVGDCDTVTPRSVAIGMHNLMPQAMLVQVAKAGHASPVEQPASVAGAIRTFVAVMG